MVNGSVKNVTQIVELDNTASIEDDVCNLNESPQFSVTDRF